MDQFQTKEDAQKTLQDVQNFLQMAVPFINYDIENLQYEFDVRLSSELKVRNILFKDTQTNYHGVRVYYPTADFISVCVSTVLSQED